MDVLIGYADVQGELLPINNDDNFCKAVTSTQSLLRIFIQLQGIREKILSINTVSLISTVVDVLLFNSNIIMYVPVYPKGHSFLKYIMWI